MISWCLLCFGGLSFSIDTLNATAYLLSLLEKLYFLVS